MWAVVNKRKKIISLSWDRPNESKLKKTYKVAWAGRLGTISDIFKAIYEDAIKNIVLPANPFLKMIPKNSQSSNPYQIPVVISQYEKISNKK